MPMPNFLLIGAAKAGTTSLFYYLRQHPQIYMPSGYQKEPEFFALEGEKLEYSGPNGIYRKKNRITDINSYRSLFDAVTTEKAIGEASTVYIYSKKVPEKIRHYIPDAKIIAILRDPAERAFSHYLFWSSQGFEPHTDYNFAKALEVENKRIQEGWSDNWHYVQRGFYYQQLRRYYEIFTPQQIKVYLYEDLLADKTTLSQDIFRFLEVDDRFVPDFQRSFKQTTVPKNRNLNILLNRPNPLKAIAKQLIPTSIRKKIGDSLKEKNQGKPKLSPKIRQQLIAVYREDILQLQDLIGKDLSSWLK
ncbi:MAG: sulfotransferase [Okeania sp. SIO3I5]|uniref:sulfotransferase n=1 Tax=Okeania sp. SIO3I5 TaxID=2607805 RepID=UPI0013BD7922|nr:sulfotransferase [Okeania sp. SIO3I5]NEQ36351.1 sulfotransferase [Okeania sp. SIO3I5]